MPWALLLTLLPSLLQMFSQGGGGGGMGGSGNPLAGFFGGGTGSGSSGLPFAPPDLIAKLTGSSQSLMGGQLGSAADLIDPLGVGLWDSVFGALFPSVPRSLKTTEIGQGLATSGNPADQMIADFMQNQLLGKGGVLSSKGGAMETGQFAQLMEWLTGSSLPNISGKTGMAGAGNSGMDLPVGRDLARVQQLLGMSPEMSASEIIPFLPKIESMVAGDSGGHLGQLAGNIMAMIDSMSGQKMAHAGSGATNPTGTGGNPLAAAMGAGGGPNKKVMDQIKALLGKGGMSGDTGNLVGASA
jgi:hypothetical protein